MARPRKWNSEAERIADYRRRQKEQLVDPDLPEREIDADPEPVLEGARDVQALIALPADAPLSDAEEQLLRDHFGYAKSERRTRAERAGIAARISASLPPPPPEVAEAIRGLQAEEQAHERKVQSYRASLAQRVPSPVG